MGLKHRKFTSTQKGSLALVILLNISFIIKNMMERNFVASVLFSIVALIATVMLLKDFKR